MMSAGIVSEGLIDTGTACPVQPTPTDADNTLQDTIDEVYSSCDGAAQWENTKPVIKTAVEAIGCGGASQAAPFALVLAAALLLN